MEPRVNIQNALPEVFKSLYQLSMVANNTNLTPIQKELIKIRASQLNGCGYCLDMHTKDAIKYGETQQRIFVLPAWRELNLFTAEEKALLALTEEVTKIGERGVSDETYSELQKYFDETTIAQAIIQVVVINAWNRIAVSTQLQVAA